MVWPAARQPTAKVRLFVDALARRQLEQVHVVGGDDPRRVQLRHLDAVALAAKVPPGADAPALRVYGPEPGAFLGSAHVRAGELIADLSNAEEVSHRVWVRDGSHMARRPVSALELPVATGMRIMAVRLVSVG